MVAPTCCKALNPKPQAVSLKRLGVHRFDYSTEDLDQARCTHEASGVEGSGVYKAPIEVLQGSHRDSIRVL